MTQSALSLGYIGLGNMGAPMAQRLVDWPGGLTVFDLRAETMAPLVEAGARAADNLADIANADLISVTVLDDAQVREVVGELAPRVKPGTIIAIHSTISDATAVQLANELAPQRIHVIDAPVSGGAPGAHKGELATMVGADDETFARVKEPFSKWASLVIHAGSPGAGTRMKLARNLLHFVAFTAAGEAQRLAESCGLNITDLGKVVRHTDAITGGPGAIMLRDTTEPVTSDSFWRPIFTHVRGLGEKDLSLALALGEEQSVELPLAALARERLAASLGVPHRKGQVMDELRRKGLDKMKEVYGWDMPDLPGDYFKYTAEHLFGTIWDRPELSMRDRRLLLLGAVSALGLDEILEIQTGAALANGELTDAELREVALFITHYVGWPLGQRVNKHVEMAIAKRAKKDAESAGD